MTQNKTKTLDSDPIGPVSVRTRQEKFLKPSPAMIGKAAALAFIGIHTDEAIARRLGIARRTLHRWKQRPEWEAAYEALVELYRWPVEVHMRRRGLSE